jgi:hypothetical protein
MALVRQKMPVREPMTEPDNGRITRPWRLFLRSGTDTASAAPLRVGAAHLTGQAAGIGPTQVPGSFPPGLYRVSIYARRTKVATTSSSLGVTIRFLDGGQALVITTGVNTDNKLDAIVAGSGMVRIGSNSPLTYEVEYASVAANEMIYSLDVVVEQVQA